MDIRHNFLFEARNIWRPGPVEHLALPQGRNYDLENIEVQLEDEDKVILLLCALPKSFESFENTMFYDKEGTVILEEVQAALRTK